VLFWLYNNIGNNLFQAGHVNEAMAHFQKAMESSLTIQKPTTTLVSFFSTRGRRTRRIVQFQKALKIQPDNPQFYTRLGMLLDKKDWRTRRSFSFERPWSFSPTMRMPITISVLYLLKKEGWMTQLQISRAQFKSSPSMLKAASIWAQFLPCRGNARSHHTVSAGS